MRIAVIGTGLIGGSIGLAAVGAGHEVVGFDADPETLARALARGAVGTVVGDVESAAAGSDLTVVAVPVGSVADAAVAALEAGASVVTDVGSVKGAVVRAVDARCPDVADRFVAGHPMAGSEQGGIDAARADLFIGATWVLTPTVDTDDTAYARVRAVVRDLGAEAVAVTPEEHDVLVALVSHVPQLAASTLMDVAATHEARHPALLQLAAGGFRDMTRIAASHPAIWLDILAANRDSVLAGLDAYTEALGAAREWIASGDADALSGLLARARAARRNLPVGVGPAAELVELRVPVPDRAGVLAEVTTLAGRLGVNIADVEIAHSLEGRAGVLVLVVPASRAGELADGLRSLGYAPGRTDLA